jgi:CheY-like chemotaxis protein
LPTQTTLTDLRVLVVDDNATNRRILEEVLTNWRMRPVAVDGAETAVVALEKAMALRQPFAIVLLDAHMPAVDGFTFAANIQKDQRHAALRIVMLTSAGSPEDVARCRDLGITGYLTKPVKQSELFDVIVSAIGVPAPESRPKKVPEKQEQYRGRALHVLLAEDNSVNQILAMKIFEKLGHRVTVVDDGRAAVDAAKSAHFDLIAMDIQMPELDGLRATREIREWEQATGEHVPIIAMTAHAMKGDRERCLEAGMDGYVAKPIRAGDLATAIRQVLHNESAEVAIDGTALLVNLDDDRELLRKLVDTFTAESHDQMARISSAIERQDGEALRLATHSVKGSLGNFVAARACQLAQELENAGKQGDFTQVNPLFAELETELARVHDELGELIKSGETEIGKSAG